MYADPLPRFDGKVALVTGASRGIGRAIAKALAAQGAHVVALSRMRGGLDELSDEIKVEGGEVSLIKLDLRDGATVDRLGPTLYERWQRLDVFVGNAGILGTLSPLGHIKEADWEMTIGINLTANWRLLRTLDPLFRLAPAARILFLTSGAAHKCRAYWGPYSISKAGLDALAKTYATEVAETNIRVNSIDPGRIRTAMRAKAYPGEDENSLPPPEALVPLSLSLLREGDISNGEIYMFDPVTRSSEA